MREATRLYVLITHNLKIVGKEKIAKFEKSQNIITTIVCKFPVTFNVFTYKQMLKASF